MGSSMSSLAACACGRNIITINNRRYFFQTNIGEGGFSYVDLIEGKKDGQFYALKRIICHDKKARDEALEEAEYCRQFHHDNIIPLVDHCVVDKGRLTEVWLLLPFHKRGTLWDEFQRFISKKEWIEGRRVLRIFYGICRAVEAFHTHKPSPLAHRDLKPANVLLTDEDVPVLMDLGSVAPARVEIKSFSQAQELQDLAAERCTMPYRAPELFQVNTHTIIDEKVDIWSLGCILYSLMCLEGPFDKAWLKKDSVHLAVQNRKLVYPDNHPFPQSFRNLVNELMVLEPETRPNIEWTISQVETLRNSQMDDS
ncbi:serine/threonine-protein kinase 16-like [Styela clava]